MCPCILQGFSKGVPCCSGKSICWRVYNVSSTIFKDISNSNNWVSCLRAFIYKFVEGFFDSSNIFWRNRCSSYFTNKLTFRFCFIRLNWLDIPNNSCILSCTSSLFLMKVIKIRFLSDCLSVVDSWITCLHIDSELSSNSLDINL